MFTVWYSTESFAEYLIANTSLGLERERGQLKLKKISESDANNPTSFHRMPTHLKRILYLDAPDIIVEYNAKPVFSLEVSTEAGTGHNVFQRFSRIAASVENGVPAFYIYPEAGFIRRQSDPIGRWDKINPLIFKAFESMMRLYEIPALLYYFPSFFPSTENVNSSSKGLIYDELILSAPDRNSSEMRKMFEAINELLEHYQANQSFTNFIHNRLVQEKRDWMQEQLHARGGADISSPETSTIIVPTTSLLNYLKRHAGSNYDFGDLLRDREHTLVYKVNAKFRGDPYPGALAALDYLKCRNGPTYEERHLNLVLAWGDFQLDENGEIVIFGDEEKSVNRFVDSVRDTYSREGAILLNKRFGELEGKEIPRYFMQVRFGSTYTKVKHLRVYSYFCDAILFHDGALWRDG